MPVGKGLGSYRATPWIVLAVVWLALGVSFGLFFSFTIFFVPLVEEFRWSRGLTAGAFSLSTVVQGVLSPGIVEADADIGVGSFVWIRDERNKQPLAVGRAIMDGPTMAREKKGKAIETLHHVGDELWHIGEEEA